MSFPAIVRKEIPKLGIRASKSAITLTPTAVNRIKQLSSPDKILKIGVRNKGCSGLSYNLEYTNKKERFDEEVKQDSIFFSCNFLGVTLIIDSKALLSILGSEMDYVEEKLASQFIFRNPNIKDACGCGMSFKI